MRHQPGLSARMLLVVLSGLPFALGSNPAVAVTATTATPGRAQGKAPASPPFPLAGPSAVQTLTPSESTPPAAPNRPPRGQPSSNTGSGRTFPAAPAAGAATTFPAPAFIPSPSTPVAGEQAFETGQVLALWPDEVAAAIGIVTMLQRYQLQPRQVHSLGNLGFTLALFQLPGDGEARALRDRLRAEQPGWIVDLNARSAPLQADGSAAPPPAAAPRLYAQKMLGDSANAASTRNGPPTLRLGVIDTGVAAASGQASALNGSILSLHSVLGPADKAADTAHGNAVLQLMVGAPQGNGFAGSAPPVLVSWVSAMREHGGKASTDSLTLALALDWLLKRDISLVNMSLGGEGDAILKAVIARVLEKNVTILAAAGNNPARYGAPVYPAAYPGVWAIAAVDAAGRPYRRSGHATYTVLAAPGAELWVPLTNGPAPHSGAYVSGTSYATALASATLAWQAPGFWDLPAAQRRAQVCQQALKLQDPAIASCGLVQKKKD